MSKTIKTKLAVLSKLAQSDYSVKRPFHSLLRHEFPFKEILELSLGTM